MNLMTIKKSLGKIFEIKSTRLQSKSTGDLPRYMAYLDSHGDIMGQVRRLSFAQEIRRNTAVKIVMSNQIEIIKNTELEVLQTDKDHTDKQTEYKDAIDFLNILKSPNSYPSPKHWNDIIVGIYEEYMANGIVALILRGAAKTDKKKIESIDFAYNVAIAGQSLCYNNAAHKISYRIDGKTFTRGKDLKTQNFFICGDDIAIIFGKFDHCTGLYQSPLMPLEDTIIWHNHISTASRAFYENACQPSAIATIHYLDPNGDRDTTDDTTVRDMMSKVIENIRSQMQGAGNAHKLLIPSVPNMDIKVTPLSIVQNANDIQKQLEITKDTIYSFFAGANVDVIEGASKYSNNRLASLKEFYDGTLAAFNSIIIDELNSFLTNWLLYCAPDDENTALERQGIYLNLNIDRVKLYKDAIKQEALSIAKEQIITKEEARKILRAVDEHYGDLEILSPELDGFTGATTNKN